MPPPMGKTPVEGMGKTLVEGVGTHPSTGMGKLLSISTFAFVMVFAEQKHMPMLPMVAPLNIVYTSRCTPCTVLYYKATILQGNFIIPEIQGPFVWDASKVRYFIDSLYQGYPIGYLIAWCNPNVKNLKAFFSIY